MDWMVWARWSRSHDLASQVSRSHTLRFLFVGACERTDVASPSKRRGWTEGPNNGSCCNHWQRNAGTHLARIRLSAWCVPCDQSCLHWASLNIPWKTWDYKLSEYIRCVFISLIVFEIFNVKTYPRLLEHPVFLDHCHTLYKILA